MWLLSVLGGLVNIWANCVLVGLKYTDAERDEKGSEEDEVGLDELLDDLAIDEGDDEPEPDVEAEGVPALGAGAGDEAAEHDPVEVPQGATNVFAFNTTGMKFV